MENLWRDIRVGLRRLVKAPGFTAVAVLSLAIGIGANATLYSMVNAIFFDSVPVAEPERMVALYEVHESGTSGFLNGFLPLSYPTFEDYEERGRDVFSHLSIWHGTWVGLTGTDRPQRILAEFVSGDYFEMLSLDPHLGTFFTSEADGPQGSQSVVVIGYGLWQRLGGDPEIIGQPLRIAGQTFTVVAVAQQGWEGAHVTNRMEAWLPTAMFTFVARPPMNELFEHRAGRWFYIIGRLKDGVSLEQAQQRTSAIAAQLEEEYPDINRDRDVTVMPLTQATIHPGDRGAYTRGAGFLALVVGALLLIACGNVASLLVARARATSKETALRLSLGATRGRLLRQLLTESMVLATLGALMAIPIAWFSLGLMWKFRGSHFGERSLDVGIDLEVLAFTFLIALGTVLIFGLLPALQATRSDVVDEIKDGPKGRSRLRGFSLQDAFVVGQVALSLVALVGAGLCLRALDTARQVDPGYRLQELAVLSMSPGTEGYDESEARTFYRRVLESVEGIPGIESAALGSASPLNFTLMRRAYPDGVPEMADDGIVVPTSIVSDGYFDTVSMQIVSGRGLTEADREGSRAVVVINQALADAVWPDRDAVGQRLRFGDQRDVDVTVVGVARTAKYTSLGEDPLPYAFLPLEQRYAAMLTVHARLAGPSATAPLATLRETVQRLDPDLPIYGVESGEEILEEALWGPRTGAALLSAYGLLTLLLAAIGLYGVIAYRVERKRRDIGVRMALGSSRGRIFNSVVGWGLILVSIGALVGVGLALLSARLLETLIFGVDTSDPLTLTISLVALLVVGAAACYGPALRATRVDPATVLRVE